MHEETFLSSWLKEDVEGTETRKRKAEVVKERCREKSRKRLLLKEGVLTFFFSVDVIQEFGDLYGDSCGFSEVCLL